MQEIKFEQKPLFEGGHRYITIDLTMHLDGKSGHIEVGYGIKETVTLEQIELGTLGTIGRRQALAGCAVVLEQLIRRAEEHLAPFG